MDTSLAHENARLRALLQTQQDTIRQMAKYNRLLSQRVVSTPRFLTVICHFHAR
ncbi:TPA: hypothetical protein ACHIBY_005055 [Escherichia coli]